MLSVKNVRVLRATSAQAPALLLLAQAHAAYERLPFDAAEYVTRIALAIDTGALLVFLACGDADPETPLGYCSLREDFSTLAARPFLHMDCLYVHADARNGGVGRALMTVVQQYAAHKAIKEIQWQTPEWNLDACRFYQRLGARMQRKRRFSWFL